MSYPYRPSSLSAVIVAVAAASSLWLALKLMKVGRRDKSLPPGPPTAPLLGNIHQYPAKNAYLKLTEWAREYGEIYSVLLGPTPVIVVSSARAIRELLEECSAVTSGRPASHMFEIIHPPGTSLALANYGDAWRIQRRAAHEILTVHACKSYLPIQYAEVSQLMYEFLANTEAFHIDIRRFSTSVALSILFGKRAPRYSTKEVTAFYESEHLLLKILDPVAQPPVDLLPILQYVPEWMGASWKGLCREAKKVTDDLYIGLFTELEERNNRGDFNGSCVETLRARAEEWGLVKENLWGLGTVLMQGAGETTSSYLEMFIMLLVQFPEVQKKAQEELDRVVGPNRTPTLKDVDKMPYIRAIIAETHRFRPVVPLSLPHMVTEDLSCMGYHIPAGSIIHTNIWGMYQDPNVYENPSVFNPDRFIESEQGTCEAARDEDPIRRLSYPFGSGRRICPGIHMADNTLRITVANLLWGFNFAKAKDPQTGKDVNVDIDDFVSGLIIQPSPFKCVITPRSQHHANVIRQQYIDATPVFERFEKHLTPEDEAFLDAQRKELGIYV